MIRITVKSSIKDLEAELVKKTEAVADQLRDNLAEATPKDTGYAASRWKVEKTKDGATITNDAPYIEALNGGHSKQAPAGFVEAEVLKVKGVE